MCEEKGKDFLEDAVLYPDNPNNRTGHFSKYAISDKALHAQEYGLLAYFNTFSMNNGECYISRKKILKDLNISRAVYDPALAALKDQGYITTKRCIRNSRRVYAFILTEPEKSKSLPTKVKEKDPDYPKSGLDRFGYADITQNLMRSPTLRFGAKCVYVYLAAKMGKSQQVKLPMEQMRRDLDMSEATINKYTTELIRYNLINKSRIRKAGKYCSVLYYLPGAVLEEANRPEKTTVIIENLPSAFH